MLILTTTAPIYIICRIFNITLPILLNIIHELTLIQNEPNDISVKTV